MYIGHVNFISHTTLPQNVGQLRYGTVYHRIFIQYEMRMARKECHKMCVGYCRVIYSKEEMPLVTAGNTYIYIYIIIYIRIYIYYI